MCCQKFLLLLSRATMKMPCFPTKCTADTDTSLSSANGEANFPALSPGRSDNKIVRSKSPGNRIHPISPTTKIYTATQPTGIIKSGTSYVLEPHVPQLRDQGKPDDQNSKDLFSRDDLSNGLISERSDELNRDHTKVPLGRLSSVLAIHSNTSEDRSSSSDNQFDASSNNYQSEASSSSKQSDRLAPSPNGIFQTEPIDNLKKKKKPHLAFGDTVLAPPPPRSQCNSEHQLGNQSIRFSSKEIKIATDCYNFHVDLEEQLFKGSLAGQPVYVARKVFEKTSNLSSEVDILKGLRHPNIITLRGFCDEDNSQALVFNFVCNRNLSFNLSSKHQKTMTWAQRSKLAVELARGLVYLHKERIIHGNVCSKNVFVTHDLVPVETFPFRAEYQLDATSFFKIGQKTRKLGKDFEEKGHLDSLTHATMVGSMHSVLECQAKERLADYVTISGVLVAGHGLHGWYWIDMLSGYLAPEYFKREFKPSEKQDVYAFGVILFKLISGRAAFDRSYKICHLDKWGRETVKEFEPNERAKLLETMADSRLKGSDFDERDMFRMIKVGELCTRLNPKTRPCMKEVLDLLMGDISDFERSQEAAEQPAVPNRPTPETNHDSPTVQGPAGRLPPSYDQNPIHRFLQMLLKRKLKRLLRSMICGENSFEPVTPTPRVSVPEHNHREERSSRTPTAPVMRPKRPRHGRRPSTPHHPSAWNSKSGHGGSPGDGLPVSPLYRVVDYCRTSGPNLDRQIRRLQFAKRKSRNLFDPQRWIKQL